MLKKTTVKKKENSTTLTVVGLVFSIISFLTDVLPRFSTFIRNEFNYQLGTIDETKYIGTIDRVKNSSFDFLDFALLVVALTLSIIGLTKAFKYNNKTSKIVGFVALGFALFSVLALIGFKFIGQNVA